jgi:CheY-like chemotaxis protein
MKKHIIWAEDHPLTRRVLTELFKKKCVDVGVDIVLEEVEDGDELIDRVRRNGYSLAFTDHNMGRVNGLDAIKTIRGENRVLPIYLLTFNDDLKEYAEQAGSTGYMVKGNYDMINEGLDRCIDLHLIHDYRHEFLQEMLKAYAESKLVE